jgi:ribosomal protein S18 acetylase RimI-like enzyme
MTINRETLFTFQDYTATYLQPEDRAILQRLLENCSDYFELVNGLPPTGSEAQKLFEAKPPTKTLTDKLVIGLWNDTEKLIGVLDVIRDYPQPGEWFVGLLLIDPTYRQHGIGQQMYQAFEQWAVTHGARYMGLGVVEQNTRASEFWQRRGFEIVEKRLPKRNEDQERVVVVMRRSLQAELTRTR